MDLSEATEQKGLDCSGFVGWSVYQIMQSRSGGPMYTDVSGNLGSLYSGKGMGTVVSQAQLASSNWSFILGISDTTADIPGSFSDSGSDKSVVILHCTPNAGRTDFRNTDTKRNLRKPGDQAGRNLHVQVSWSQQI